MRINDVIVSRFTGQQRICVVDHVAIRVAVVVHINQRTLVAVGNDAIAVGSCKAGIIKHHIVDGTRADQLHFEPRGTGHIKLQRDLTVVACGLNKLAGQNIAVRIIENDLRAGAGCLFDVLEGDFLHPHTVVEIKKDAAAAGIVIGIGTVAILGDNQQTAQRVGGQIIVPPRRVGTVKDHRLTGPASG